MGMNIYAIAVLSWIAVATAGCDRAQLKESMDTFFKSSIQKAKDMSIFHSAKVSQNNQVLPSIETSAWSNITGFYKPFRIDSIDTEACTMASFVMVNENSSSGSPEPGLVSVRMKTESNSKIVKELEILNVLKGSHALFAPGTFPNTAAEMWSKEVTGKFSREELIRRANTYPSGIQAGDGSDIPAGPTCPRIENGVQTTTNCNIGLAKFKQPVTNRRWVADTLTGVVLGEFYFDKVAAQGLNHGLWLNEYFKVDDGKLVGIQACMKELPGKFVDVWQA
jgi:hypothetical protein